MTLHAESDVKQKKFIILRLENVALIFFCFKCLHFPFSADKRSDAGREKQYKEIVQRRKLVELAKAQAQEVAVLRAEVERLRMRTFPALVQVEH